MCVHGVVANVFTGYKAQTLPGSTEALEDEDFKMCREWNLWLRDAIDKASEMLGMS